MQVRKAVPQDAAKVIRLLTTIYGETDFMLMEPDEFQTTEAQQAQRLEQMTGSDSWVMFVCESDGELIGFASGSRSSFRRTRHSLYLGMGVRQAWIGKGVGGSLLQALVQWAQSVGVHRMELHVAVDNTRAIALYRKLGFEREGVRRHARHVRGGFADELLMSKLLPTATAAGSDQGSGE